MSKYRIVAETLNPINDYGDDFMKSKATIWYGDNHPSKDELPELTTPEQPAKQGSVYLQQQRILRLGWRTIDASVQRI